MRKVTTWTTRTIALGGVLALAACSTATSDSETNQSQSSSNGSNSGYTIVAEPDDQGKAVLSAIAGAQTSIDIPIYTIGGDPQFDGALAAAKARGVNVRVMMNGGHGAYVPGAKSFAQTLNAAPGPGTSQVNWSSNNFAITHQKSVIIDAADKSGAPLSSGSLPPSARVVVSTGNFSGYQVPKGPFQKFYYARDYEMTTADPTTIATIESAFASDFSCAPRTTINPDGITASDPLGWSNGTTGANSADAAGQYPSLAEGYPYPSELGPNAKSQGNARPIQEALINSAKPGDVLRVTNEEMSDKNIIAALTQAAQSGVDVRIIMTAPPKVAYGKPNAQYTNLQGLANAGATIHLFTKNDFDSTQLYIHSKTITVNDTAGYAGSQNFSQTSLDFNRELGVQFNSSNSPQAVSFLNSTFDTDWAVSNPAQVTVWTKGSTPDPPMPNASSKLLAAADNMDVQLPKKGAEASSQTCGAIVTS